MIGERGRRRGERFAAGTLSVLVTAATVAGLSAAVPPASATPASGTISTWAGGTGQGPALDLAVQPGALVARGQFVYVADQGHHAVRILDTNTGMLRTVAGNGDPEVYSSQTPRRDGGPATADRIESPTGVALDPAGRLYISDQGDDRVRRVDTAGIITTFAGGGSETGDGVPAADAAIGEPVALASNQAGDMFVIDSGNRVLKISATGTVTTVAGCLCAGSDPENAPATSAGLTPRAIALDPSGHLFIANGDRILRLDDAGILRRVAGGGHPADGHGDGGAATAAWLGEPHGLGFDGEGNLLIADSPDGRVRRVDAGGTITTVAGGGSPVDGLGDGGSATSASLAYPLGLTSGSDGSLYVADFGHLRLRKVAAGVITTVAGNGGVTGGDGGIATNAQFASPRGMARDAAGVTYLADAGDHRVRRIDTTGTVSTVAGTGSCGYSGDGGPAIAAALCDPRGVAVDGKGAVYIADTGNGRIRRVDASGTIITVVGGGSGPASNGGPATGVALAEPEGIAVDRGGNVYVANAARILRVTPEGALTTFAGGGTPTPDGDGDGGPATSAALYMWNGAALAFDPTGQLYIADDTADRVRKVDLAGVITTVVGHRGGGNQVVTGAHLPATQAQIDEPGGMAFDSNGSLYVVEGYRSRILKVDLMGRMSVVGGFGPGSREVPLGDGGPVSQARIDASAESGLAFDGSGNLFIVGAGRIRRVEAASVPDHVSAMGWNGVGQVGDGTTTDRHTATQVVGLSGVKAISAGFFHTLALRGDGTVWAWGWNYFGQLGDGTTIDRAAPVQVQGLTDIVAVAGGAYHSLALGSDGTVWAWGWNVVGELGDGTTTDRSVPVRVRGLTGARAISAGGFHSLAIGPDGVVSAWGWNHYGQLGTGSATEQELNPVPVPGTSGAVSISAGGDHSLMSRMVNGSPTVLGWGWNALGQVGDGTTVDRRTPVPTASPVSAERVWAGPYDSFADDVFHSAWGWNGFRQLGTDTNAAIVASPTSSTLPGGVDTVAPGAYHTVVLLVDGSVLTWGWNGYGALGSGPAGVVTPQVGPAAVAGLRGAGAIGATALGTVVVR